MSSRFSNFLHLQFMMGLFTCLRAPLLWQIVIKSIGLRSIPCRALIRDPDKPTAAVTSAHQGTAALHLIARRPIRLWNRTTTTFAFIPIHGVSLTDWCVAALLSFGPIVIDSLNTQWVMHFCHFTLTLSFVTAMNCVKWEGKEKKKKNVKVKSHWGEIKESLISRDETANIWIHNVAPQRINCWMKGKTAIHAPSSIITTSEWKTRRFTDEKRLLESWMHTYYTPEWKSKARLWKQSWLAAKIKKQNTKMDCY